VTGPRETGLCPEAPHDVEDLLDGRLPVDAETAMLAHLETCAVCRGVLEEEQRLRDLLGGPAGFVDGVMDAVRRQAAAGSRRPSIRWPVLRMAAAAAVVVAASLLLLIGDEGPPSPGAPGAPPTADSGGGPGPEASDLLRRARLFLAAAGQAPVETLRAELASSGLEAALGSPDLSGLEEPDRDVLRRVTLLAEAWRNDAPVARAEIDLLTGGLR
jgi:anti-sigma factor RsiW